MKKKSTVVVLVVLLFAGVFGGCSSDYHKIENTFYVSVEGDDKNPGTLTEPWKTIQKAADSLKAGEVALIREGIYNEKVLLKNSGEPEKYIVFKSFKDETVIIDGSGIDWGYNWSSLFDINEQSYVKIENINVKNSRWAGFGSTTDSEGSSHVEILSCSTFNTQASGIIFSQADNIIIDGNSIERACISTDIGSQEGISLDNVDNFEIKNNEVFDFTNDVTGKGGEAIDAKNGSSDGKIYNNTIHHIPKIGIYIDAYKATSGYIEIYENNIYNCGLGIAVAAEKGGLLNNVDIHDNTISDCNTGFTVGGWSEGYSHDMDTIRFADNTLTGITSKGVRLNNPDAKNVYITNNRISGSSSMIPIDIDGGQQSETTVEGNVFE
ncbi:right-handed parallel beta-helix repeat-containing protein [Alkalibacter mobilis]|uniref:right-handed parallel beta-helix repeat-containing protein n=1 Tax=Alkalibacter mobilis TaxID=2787712 RepID=UPI00189F1D9C|nr:right-handed parallel beta-helix repeat-containing protein [Alkalibacter mobilis]MBF7097345.1 right-handed parallel beta-helix repeat-containing protein [Alkalibacter mobilis]